MSFWDYLLRAIIVLVVAWVSLILFAATIVEIYRKAKGRS